MLQDRDAGECLGGFPEDQAERDGVQARAAVFGGEQEAEQAGVGKFGPQSPVEVVGDGAGGEGRARHAVGRDRAEHGLGRLDGRLLFFGEGEVHCPVPPCTGSSWRPARI